ncbi:MAG TPA: c-type cytochrome [Candidatus Limnocylindria bacterium]|nr:c-type cytochrome [Candidatus Limnocylindria bacterium]
MTVHTPIETRTRAIPAWALWLTVFVFLVGGVYAASNLTGENPPLAIGGSPGASATAGPQQALAIMQQAQPTCQACHGDELSGGVGPDLHGIVQGPKSENLQDLAAEHPDDWIFLWIQGTDEAVQGIDRMGMPAFGDQLTEEEIQAIVDYLQGL